MVLVTMLLNMPVLLVHQHPMWLVLVEEVLPGHVLVLEDDRMRVVARPMQLVLLRLGFEIFEMPVGIQQ
jgi:hypothetical protein